MSQILVVSRTRMNNGVCCGAIDMNSKEFIRLHNERGGRLPFDAPYQIGEIYDATYQTSWNVRPAPHIEDKQLIAARFVRKMNDYELKSYIDNNLPISEGGLSSIFEGKLNTASYAPYIDRNAIPRHSVCFWKADAPITKYVFLGKVKYRYKGNNISFVGYQDPIDVIPAGTIIRMSLANWWSKDDDTEQRCYLQLSGWYGV